MREVKRIPKVLEAVRRIWLLYPDLRLAQLILNLDHLGDLYAIEDDELVDRLFKILGDGKLDGQGL